MICLGAAPRPGGTVSIRELLHPPARKAVEAAAAAQKFAGSGNYRKAVEQLQKAIRISPEYAAAHSNLAVEYIHLKDYARARAEVERALEISGPNALAYLNATEHRYPEAIEAAKAALRADPADGPPARAYTFTMTSRSRSRVRKNFTDS